MAIIISFPGTGKRASSPASATSVARAEVLSFPHIRHERHVEEPAAGAGSRGRRQRDRLEILE
jgi:hypothetical protein